MIEERGLTLVGIGVANLDDEGAVQLMLPLEGHSEASLDTALDDIRHRFGSASVTRAVLLGHEPGISPPMLPD